MKTLKKIQTILFLTSITLLLANCGSSSGGSSSSTTSSTSYYMSNGYCYSSSTGQVVSTSYCSSTSGYYMSNGYCYSSSTGQVVNTTYCSSTSTGYTWSNGYCYSASTGQVVNSAYCSSSSTTTSGAVAQQCVGYYYYMTTYGTQMVYCTGANCRGYTLYNATTYQWNYCQ